MKLIIATGNPGKLREMHAIIKTFPELDLEVHSITEMNIPEPEEPHDTHMGNAQHKAKYYAQHTKQATLSEDSGLCIEALNGFPGVRTKEFVEEYGGLPAAYAKLAELLLNTDNKRAYFICAATIYLPEQDIFISAEDTISGLISFPPRGNQGLGFDPIFIPNGFNNTMAELGDEVKNLLSHRAKAMRSLLQNMQEYMHSIQC